MKIFQTTKIKKVLKNCKELCKANEKITIFA